VTIKFRRIQLQNWKNFARAAVDIQDRVFLVVPRSDTIILP